MALRFVSFSSRMVRHSACHLFVPSAADPCLYMLDAGKVLIVVHVDDIMLSGSDEEYLLTIIEQLKERFDIHGGRGRCKVSPWTENSTQRQRKNDSPNAGRIS